MPTAAILAYMERLPKLKARLSITLNEVVSLPWMKEDAQKAIVSRWNRQAEAEDIEKRPPPPVLLRMMGIGVEIVRK